MQNLCRHNLSQIRKLPGPLSGLRTCEGPMVSNSSLTYIIASMVGTPSRVLKRLSLNASHHEKGRVLASNNVNNDGSDNGTNHDNCH